MDIPTDRDKRECFFHVALLSYRDADKKTQIRIGSPSANNHLKKELQCHGGFGGIFDSKNTLFEKLNLDEIPNLAGALEKILATDFRTITINDPEYPDRLRKVDGATPVLYVQGDISLLQAEKAMAVVGTRQPDDIDKSDCARIVQRLVNKGYVIVSGLAYGCDTAAHTSALLYKGRTIAVLGTPLDRCSPKFNIGLLARIREAHLVVSQYPIGIRTFPSYFAHRNQTTVGLSDGIVVVRANDKSGTQNAVRDCLKQGKQLYVLQNNVVAASKLPDYEWIKNLEGMYTVPNGRFR
ncbi:DNA-protecting protein DprA [Candidatus Woesearchaeota archaeon]|nr:DNA-protecting protein DprA [Candidatus Woesearchaeota archaeon]